MNGAFALSSLSFLLFLLLFMNFLFNVLYFDLDLLFTQIIGVNKSERPFSVRSLFLLGRGILDVDQFIEVLHLLEHSFVLLPK